MTSYNSTGNGKHPDSHQPDDNQFEFNFGADDHTPLTTADKFEAFHRENPHVFDLLVHLSREWITTTGRHKLGVAQLWERMRWDLAVRATNPDDLYKLNNDFKAYYARLLMKQEADLANLFDLRKSEADAWMDRRAA